MSRDLKFESTKVRVETSAKNRNGESRNGERGMGNGESLNGGISKIGNL